MWSVASTRIISKYAYLVPKFVQAWVLYFHTLKWALLDTLLQTYLVEPLFSILQEVGSAERINNKAETIMVTYRHILGNMPQE